MRINLPKGPIWLVIVGVTLESIDLILRFMKEKRLRGQVERDEKIIENKNLVLNRCLEILQRRNDG